MIYVLLINRSSFIRRTMKKVLEREKNIRIVKQASSFSNADEILSHSHQEIDVVIMDTHLGNTEPLGLSFAAHLRNKFPSLKILMLSFQRTGAYVFHMSQLGIQGYLFMDSGSKEIVTAINTIHQDKTYYSESVKVCLDQYRLYRQTKEEKLFLTPSEIEYIQTLAELDPSEMSVIPEKRVSIEAGIWNNITSKLGTKDLEMILEIAYKMGWLP